MGRISLGVRLVRRRVERGEFSLRGFQCLPRSEPREHVGHAVRTRILHGRALIVIVRRIIDEEVLRTRAGVVRARCEDADDARDRRL